MNDEPSQYGDSGYIQTEQTKEERDAKVPKVFLGNVKVVWTNGENCCVATKEGAQQTIDNTQSQEQEPDLPF